MRGFGERRREDRRADRKHRRRAPADATSAKRRTSSRTFDGDHLEPDPGKKAQEG